MYAPLSVDQHLEQTSRARGGRLFQRFSRMLRWLQQYSPLLIYYELPVGRKCVEIQLSLRPHFPEEEWKKSALQLSDVAPILRIIEKEMQWPNCNFIPTDPLRLLLIEEYNEFAAHFVFVEISRETGVTVPQEEIRRMCSEDATLIDLVRLILERRKTKVG